MKNIKSAFEKVIIAGHKPRVIAAVELKKTHIAPRVR